MTMQTASFRTLLPVLVIPPKPASPTALPKLALVKRLIEKGASPESALRVVMAHERRGQRIALPQKAVFEPGAGRPDLNAAVPVKKARILEELQSGPLSMTNIVIATGFSRKATARLLDALREEGKVEVIGQLKNGGFMWGVK